MKFIFSLLTGIVLILTFGTIVYHSLEKWTWIDSLYFTTSTIATVGYGDIHPTTEATRLFSVFFIIVGVGYMLYALSNIFEHFVEKGFASRFPKALKNIKIRREPRWDFGGGRRLALKIRSLFRKMNEKVEKYKNKKRYGAKVEKKIVRKRFNLK
jgi:hypothetical protein